MVPHVPTEHELATERRRQGRFTKGILNSLLGIAQSMKVVQPWRTISDETGLRASMALLQPGKHKAVQFALVRSLRIGGVSYELPLLVSSRIAQDMAPSRATKHRAISSNGIPDRAP